MSTVSNSQKSTSSSQRSSHSSSSDKATSSSKVETRKAEPAKSQSPAVQDSFSQPTSKPVKAQGAGDSFEASGTRALKAGGTPPAPTATPTATPGATTSPVPTATPVPVPAPTPVAAPTAEAVSPSTSVGPVTGPVSEQAADGLLLGADGQLYGAQTPLEDIPAVQPNPANLPPGVQPSNELIIHVNGIQNDVATQETALQAVADRTGAQVIGIHNSTAGANLGGFLLDVGQCALDKAGLYNFNPATVTMGETLYKALKEDVPVHLMAHSQGALVTSGALSLVKNQLERDARLPGAQGEEARQMLERFNNIKVETFGGAAASYPSGPQYVHYINTGDPVPMLTGLGSKDDLWRNDIRSDSRPSPWLEAISAATLFNPGNDYRLQQAAGGPGAVVHYINDLRGANPFANHDFVQDGPNPTSGGYLAQRVPFEDAQRGQFHDVDTHR